MTKRTVVQAALPLICMAWMGTGCATGRWADLKDCGALSIGVGAGLDVSAKVGCLFQPAVGVIGSRTVKVGHENRARSGVWEEKQFVWPVEWFRRATPQPSDEDAELLAIGASYTRSRCPALEDDPADDACFFPVLADRRHRDPFSFHELTDLQVGATLGIVSMRVGINPLEILDFLLGFVGLDIAGDDSQAR
jgi:hypothetical protein